VVWIQELRIWLRWVDWIKRRGGTTDLNRKEVRTSNKTSRKVYFAQILFHIHVNFHRQWAQVGWGGSELSIGKTLEGRHVRRDEILAQEWDKGPSQIIYWNKTCMYKIFIIEDYDRSRSCQEIQSSIGSERILPSWRSRFRWYVFPCCKINFQ